MSDAWMTSDTSLEPDEQSLVKSAECGRGLSMQEIASLAALVRRLDRDIISMRWAEVEAGEYD